MRTRTHPVVDVIAQVPLFADLSHRDLQRVAEHAELLHFRAGNTVLLERYHGEQLHVVLDGEAEVRRGGALLAVVGPGALIGEVGMLTGADRNATVVARTALRTLALDATAFAELIRHPRIAAALKDEARRHQAPAPGPS